MCNFFSFCSDEKGKFYYFDWGERKILIKNNPKNYQPDSHNSIADLFSRKEDNLNKFEYNPLTKIFKTDMINIKDNSTDAEKWVKELDFKIIIEPLIIKPIINPLELQPKLKSNGTVYKRDIEDLEKWVAVYSTVGSVVGSTVSSAVYSTVGSVVGSTVSSAVYSTVGSVVGSVVGSTVSSTVYSYISSFFDIKYKYNFSSLNRLWGRGFVPSFDGKTWRLHCRENAKIVHTLNS